MARNIVANGLCKAGKGIFDLLSRWEEKGVLPSLSRFLKISLLGLLVTAIASCCKGGIPPLVTCYKPAVVYPQVIEMHLSPNPTNGAEKVKVTAKAELIDTKLDSTAYIISARCTLDTFDVKMNASDGAFDETAEELEAEVPLQLKPCTTLVHVFVESNVGSIGSDAEYLYVTSKD
ncbi:hypothetical protein JXM67_12690 [candidate division WOR-3 bacterium]|nr:hypothetical protein [candidate division WOR-3 bacterium]